MCPAPHEISVTEPTSSVAISVAALSLSFLALAIAVAVLFVQLAGCR